MRLFLLAVGLLAVAGCNRGGTAGAVRVEIFYATFRPGCLTLTVEDELDETRREVRELPLDESRSEAKRVAVFTPEGWSRSLRVTASARERSCQGAEVASQTKTVTVPEAGTEGVFLDLRAQDLDGDGYVSARTPERGTDCNDEDAAVHPGATETCNGVDTNCVSGEADATGTRTWYEDLDGDGHGNPQRPVMACEQPARAAATGTDCQDTSAAIRPGVVEAVCNGVDDNCDGTPDDAFGTGQPCVTEQRCAGLRTCSADQRSTSCSSTRVPSMWYVDRDGDGRAGTNVGNWCEKPEPEAVATQSDCDGDASRFIGGSEVCDLLDNDCDGQTDENVCAGVQWTQRTGVGGSEAWNAVAAWAPGQVWLAGSGGRVRHVSKTGETVPQGCTGDWQAAWARPSDGRVFLGSMQGVLATAAVGTAASCELVSVAGVTLSINGLVGFERGGVTTVYAVTSGGHVLKWEYPGTAAPGTPTLLTQVAANLRDVHGASEDALLAVGAEDYQVVNGPIPQAFLVNGTTGQAKRETLPDIGTGVFLLGVHVVDGRLAYAVGGGSTLLERSNGTWKKLPSPGASVLLDVVAFDRTTVFALSTETRVHLQRFNGTAWSRPFSQDVQTLVAIDGVGPQEMWAAGFGGTLVHWGP
jgi:hypothetical protein